MESPDFDDLFAEQFLDANNFYRRMHEVPELFLSTDLSIEAHRWAERLANQRHIVFTEQPGIGENITFFPNSLTAKDICRYWYNECKEYEFETPGWQAGTNYFTQIIWRDTKEVGVGTANVPPLSHKNMKTGEVVSDSLNDYQVVVAFYKPSGNSNYAGQFEVNVRPRSAGQNNILRNGNVHRMKDANATFTSDSTNKTEIGDTIRQ